MEPNQLNRTVRINPLQLCGLDASIHMSSTCAHARTPQNSDPLGTPQKNCNLSDIPKRDPKCIRISLASLIESISIQQAQSNPNHLQQAPGLCSRSVTDRPERLDGFGTGLERAALADFLRWHASSVLRAWGLLCVVRPAALSLRPAPLDLGRGHTSVMGAFHTPSPAPRAINHLPPPLSLTPTRPTHPPPSTSKQQAASAPNIPSCPSRARTPRCSTR